MDENGMEQAKNESEKNNGCTRPSCCEELKIQEPNVRLWQRLLCWWDTIKSWWDKAGRVVISEEQNIQALWYEKARKISTERELYNFVSELSRKYSHDYGTICHAIVAASLGAAHCVDRSLHGGITGFQADAIMWEFIVRWGHKHGALRLIEFDNMLYPQYEEYFAKTVTPTTWASLQKKAKEMLLEHPASPLREEVLKHWQSIVDGVVPFGYVIKEK